MSFELTDAIRNRLESEFFNGSVPASLLADPDWCIHLQSLPGWEILFLNDHVLQVTGGIDGDHTPPPFDLSGHLVQIHPKADLDRLADWPSLRQINVPHILSNLRFVHQLPQLETLILENISWVDDFTPLAGLTQLKAIGLGNGEDEAHAAAHTILDKVRAQAPNLPEINLDLWQEDAGPH